ncbi:hypothetical protein A1O1_07926 [Capronia coronata CBS 617.96]|uniref:Heterokaryon incompatibility domain-containing protein n=1 Tax=Capronia coronata CBS 617.96 TaxID=1182541 RepID=W9XY56_9EURO|nr:uncharacterized protein A1O1_07926 [Capronia coronata CBS 617.96]EXJ81861.1 hypothetical protein A1O1_07926 [Capronia coronata CBS 617.96]
MAPQDDPYRYTPLKPNQQGIRLVRIAKEPQTDPIQPATVAAVSDNIGTAVPAGLRSLSIGLETFSLATAPPYIALSYVWGSPERSHAVSCCGKVLFVTANLEAALCALAIRDHWIWVDAICINQDHIAERNSQLRLMRNIFGSAMEVVVYLGDSSVTQGEAIKTTLHTLKEDLHKKDKEQKRQDDVVNLGMLPVQTASTLVDLMHRPWFTRAWVISEVVLNRHVRFLYGSTEFVIDDLLECLPSIQSVTSALMDSTAPSGCVRSSFRSTVRTRLHLDSIRQLRASLCSQEAIPLYRALGCGRSATVSDPRDKVYAFMSIVDNDVIDVLTPDYSPSNSAEDVYLGLAHYSLTQPDMAIDMLRHAGHQRETLPSWAPDMSEYLRHPFPKDGGYHCSAGSKPNLRQVRGDPRSLLVRGAVVDVIREVLEPCTFSFHDDAAYFSERPGTKHGADLFLACARLHSFLHCKAQEYFRDKDYPTKERLEDVIRRTMTADSTGRLDWTVYQAFYKFWKPPEDYGGLANMIEEPSKLFTEADAYMQAVALIQQGRRIAFTEGSYMATVPDFAEEGDVIVIALGAPMPLVLRPSHDGSASRVVGEAYVHGIMNAELVHRDDQSGGFRIDGGEVFDILVV